MVAPLKHTLLLVDDEPNVRFAIQDYFSFRDYEVVEASSAQQALRLCTRSKPDVAVIDHHLPDGDALELMGRLRQLDPRLPIIILTGHGSIDLAVQAMKRGADHFITKPVQLTLLLQTVEMALGTERRTSPASPGSSAGGCAPLAHEDPEDPFLGTSEAVRQLERTTRKIARSESTILIQGETGTGKGVLARWLHRNGPRANGPLVDVNCASLSGDLLESELFGHEKGAFTGAVTSKPGLLEVAHRGILFLDELGDMLPAVQAKLLKVLEERRFRRMGDVKDRSVDVQLIAATHCNLVEMVRQGRFRRDLYFRINTFPLTMPSLRDRAEDIPLLAQSVLARIGPRVGKGELSLSASAERALVGYGWPGNLRELRNVLERAALLCESSEIALEDLRFEDDLEATQPPHATEPTPAPTQDEGYTLAELERAHIERALRASGGSVPQAARRLGIPRSSLYDKLKRLGLSPSSDSSRN